MKYSAETLKGMAEIVVGDHNSGGHNSLLLMVALAMRTGLDGNEVFAKIKELAA